MTDVLNVQIREEVGTNAVKKVRRKGRIPAVLYGHGEQNLNLSVCAEELEAAIRHGSQLVQLEGDVKDSALIREVQWDTFGVDVLHFDLVRARASEKVNVNVSIALRGEAPGVRAGGVIDHQLHELEMLCPAGSIPNEITVSINHLELHGTIKVADLDLPANSSPLIDETTIVVQCIEPTVEEEAPAEAVAGEPEVIGAQAEEDESDNS